MRIRDHFGGIARIVLMVAILSIAIIILIKWDNDTSASERDSMPKEKLHVDLSHETAEEVEVTIEEKPEEIVQPTNIDLSFCDVNQLIVEEYHFTSAGAFEDQKEFWGFDIPFGNKSFVLQYSGCVTAGVNDFENIVYTYDHNKGQLQITAPHVEIISVYIDPNSAQVLDENSGIFNSIEASDVTNFLATQEDAALQLALDNGIIETAQERVEGVLENYAKAVLQDTPLENYEIVFVKEADSRQ